MTLTPLLASAIESLVHGIEHYVLKYGTSNKFTLIHIDQSVELLVKAKIQSIKGQSIFTKNGKTLDYYPCLDKLEANKIALPERSLLEEIHTKRNSSQHLGDSFDDYTVGFYTKFVYSFFRTFIKEEFQEELSEHIPDYIITYVNNIIIEPTKIYENQLQYLTTLIDEGRYAESIISSWNALEFLIKGYSDESIGKSLDDIIGSIKSKRKISDSEISTLKSIQSLKNSILFSEYEVDLNTAVDVQHKLIDLSNTSIVVVPVKTPEKINKGRISNEENAVPVRIIDDTSPVENEQELFFTNLKLYNSDNKYVSDFETIFKLYKNRLSLTIEEHSGYVFLTQSSIFHNLPCWYWARNISEDEITNIISQNIKSWPFLSFYYSLDTLLLITNTESDKLLRDFSNDARTRINSKAHYFLTLKKDVMAIKDYLSLTQLVKLDHLKKVNPSHTKLLKQFYEKIEDMTAGKEAKIIDILKADNDFELLNDYYLHGNENTKSTILDVLSHVKDEKSISFYVDNIKNEDYKTYRDIILKLDKAVYCPRFS